MIDNWIIYIIGTYLAGVLTGALGEYFSNILTDIRHNREAKVEEKKLFQDVTSQMPDLISEMKNDLSKPENKLIREFFISKRTWIIPLPEGEHFFSILRRIIQDFGIR